MKHSADFGNHLEAKQIFWLLKNNTTELKKILNELTSFREYLLNLCNHIPQNGLKLNFIYQFIFTNNIQKRDEESYIKANLFAASDSLFRVISKIEKQGLNSVIRTILSDFICDLKPFIGRFDKQQDYDWLLLNTNSHLTNFYFDLAVNTFWEGMPSFHPEEKLVLSTSAPFIIRQSIEYKIKRILGIDYILINGNPDINTTSKCFKAILANKQFYKSKKFSFETIQKIHSWTNYYIHSGYRPEPWRTETAINYLENLFHSGTTISKPDSYSSYAGIEIRKSDINYLNANTEKTIINESTGLIQIKWLDKPEVAII